MADSPENNTLIVAGIGGVAGFAGDDGFWYQTARSRF
jgi:hypothetical protein